MKTKRLKMTEEGYITAILPCSKAPDWEKIFPAGQIPNVELLDDYGNLQYKVHVTEEEIKGELVAGTDTARNATLYIVSQKPTAEQLATKRAKAIVNDIRKQYTINDEIAELRKAILAIKDQKDIPESFIDQSDIIGEVKSAYPKA